MDIQYIKKRINGKVFICTTKHCTNCVFYIKEETTCGGTNLDFDFKAIKASKVRTLKGLLKFKSKTNNYKYPKLK